MPTRFAQRFVVATLSLCLLALSAPSAWAKSPPRKSLKQKEQAAKTACAVGRLEEGIELLGQLYTETNNPIFINNQGRCYQQNEQPERAASRFKEYLRKATNLPEDERLTVERYIAECTAEAAAKKPAVEPPPPAPIVMAPLPPPPVSQEPASIPLPSEPPPPSSPGRGLRIGGLVAMGVGAAAVGMGVVFMLKENSMADRMRKPGENTDSNESDRSLYQRLSIIGYATGGLALATGLGLYLWGGAEDKPSSGVALVPMLRADGISLALTGALP